MSGRVAVVFERLVAGPHKVFAVGLDIETRLELLALGGQDRIEPYLLSSSTSSV